MKTHVMNIAYVLLHVLSMPLKIVGLFLISYRRVWTSRRLGVSATAILVINERWTMDVFGIREDAASRALNRTLPNSSVAGRWLALFPLYLLYRMSGENRFYPRIPVEGEEEFHDVIIARTLYFDEIIERSKDGVDQFVLLGAGFDTRAYGHLNNGDLRFFELDQKETQRLKRTCLEQAGVATAHVTYVEADFSKGDWFQKLAESGYDAGKKTLFLWEGVTMYLSPSDVERTLQKIREHSAPGSLVLADFYARSVVTGDYFPGMETTQSILKLTGEELVFGLDFSEDHESALTQYMESQGFKLGQRKFLAAASPKGPFLAVAEGIFQNG